MAGQRRLLDRLRAVEESRGQRQPLVQRAPHVARRARRLRLRLRLLEHARRHRARPRLLVRGDLLLRPYGLTLMKCN